MFNKFKMIDRNVREFDEYVSKKKIHLMKDCARIDYFLEQNLMLSNHLRQKEESAIQEIKYWCYQNTNVLVDDINEIFADLYKFTTERRMISYYKSYEYKFSLETLLSKNKYCLGLIENSLNHRNISSYVNLSTTITNVIHSNKKFFSKIDFVTADLEYYLKENSDYSISKYYFVRDAMKNIRTSKMFDLLKIHLHSNEKDGQNAKDKSECACCFRSSKNFFRCISCDRCYHKDCHIPKISPIVIADGKLLISCTMCKDMSSTLKNNYVTENIGENQRQIMERIVLEIYCQIKDYDYFRDSRINSGYIYCNRELISSLYVIKQRLHYNIHYTTLIDLIQDLKLIFTDAIDVDNHEASDLAHQLRNHLYVMVDSWIPFPFDEEDEESDGNIFEN